MTKTPGQNCMPGSAWETWQQAGANWRAKNPDATPEDARQAAAGYATRDGWPKHTCHATPSMMAQYRAFLECAL